MPATRATLLWSPCSWLMVVDVGGEVGGGGVAEADGGDGIHHDAGAGFAFEEEAGLAEPGEAGGPALRAGGGGGDEDGAGEEEVCRPTGRGAWCGSWGGG